MKANTQTPALQATWNKGKLVGQKSPLKLKEIWAIRIRLQLAEKVRDLALFNLAIDSKLRGCDLLSLEVSDIAQGRRIMHRAIVMQRKTHRPVQFEVALLSKSSEGRAGAICGLFYNTGTVIGVPSRVKRFSTAVRTCSSAQICIGAAGAGLTPPANQSCKSSRPVHAGNSTTFSSQCGFADTTVVVRKIDARTWEMKTSIIERMGQMGMPDFAQQRKMLEISLKDATSAEERAAIQDTLDHWEEYKADMRKIVAESKAAAVPGAETRSSNIVTRLTRIGDTCKVAAAPAAKGMR